MTILDGFLESIREDIDDDTPRLIGADYLADQGDPRGELMRAQCRLADWIPDHADRRETAERASRLRGEQLRSWLADFATEVESVDIRRGTLTVTSTAANLARPSFIKHFRDFFEKGWIETLRLEDLRSATRTTNYALLTEVPSIDFSGQSLDDPAFARFLDAARLDRLTHLDLSNNSLTDVSLVRLRNWDGLPQLLSLDLRNNRFKNRAVKSFLKETESHRLRRLELQGNDLSENTLDQYVHWSKERPATPGARPRVINHLGMQFVEIPAGSFRMGAHPNDDKARKDEKPQHLVTLTTSFYLGVFPVTQRQYERVMGENPAYFTRRRKGGPDNPVEHVDFRDANDFCERLSNYREEQDADRSYRLPTEAEWEHACRAGTETPFYYGSLPPSTVFNYDGNHVYGGVARGPYLERTTPVGSYAPSPFGLYDMHGNVWEWCSDYHSQTYYRRSAKKDPKGPRRGTTRVIRGGCWDCIGAYCRSSHRHGDPPGTRDDYNGFRIVLVQG